MQKIVVTGGAGFIGSHFVDLALEHGCSVLLIDKLTYAGSMENLKMAAASPKFQFVKADICDQKEMSLLFKNFQPEAVLNFAAESHVDNSITGPKSFIETNIVGTFSLLEASREYFQSLDNQQKVHFKYLQVSTDEVFGDLGPVGHFTEKTPYNPHSPYSASKASADHLVRAWRRTYNLPTMITNCSNNYGPRQFPEKLIPHMIQCALSEKPLPVYGDGKNIRDWIHVKDHCRGVWLALTKGTSGDTYCFGGRSERTNFDVVTLIASELDQQRPRARGKYSELIQFVKDRPGHDWRYAIDDALAEEKLGFKRAFRNFDDGLKDTVAWYLKNQDWVDKVTRQKKEK
jgi:dTDP-glucose 4,6-dehydratase